MNEKLKIKGSPSVGYQVLLDGEPVKGCIDCKLHLGVGAIPEVTLTLYALNVEVDLEGGVASTENIIQ